MLPLPAASHVAGQEEEGEPDGQAEMGSVSPGEILQGGRARPAAPCGEEAAGGQGEW